MKGDGEATPNRQTQNRNPNPNTREENGKKREGREKKGSKKEENPALLSLSAKRDALSVWRPLALRQVKGQRAFLYAMAHQP